MRHSVLRFTAALCSLFVLASTPAMADAAAPKTPAAKYIESLGNQALSTISDKKLSTEKKQATLEKLFKENLDFDWVAKFVMGRFWREATPDQRTRYVAAYTDFLTKNYTSRFSEYSSGSFKITSAKDLEKGDSVVSMAIAGNEKDAQPVLIDYKIRKSGGGFKVFDIIVEGVSLITSQRSEFSAVINKNGIDGLISQLATK